MIQGFPRPRYFESGEGPRMKLERGVIKRLEMEPNVHTCFFTGVT